MVGRSGLDELVLGATSKLVEVDRNRPDCDFLRAAGMDPSLPREKLDGHSGHTSTTHVGHTWTLSLGPTSVLRLCRIARGGGFPNRGELVPPCERHCAVLSVDQTNQAGRRESGCPIWGQLCRLSRTYRSLLARIQNDPTRAMRKQFSRAQRFWHRTSSPEALDRC